MQPQPTGFGGMQQQHRAPPPILQQQPGFLNTPPLQQPNRLMSASPGFGGLVPQMTGYVDPWLMMLSQSFLPTSQNQLFLPPPNPSPMSSIQLLNTSNDAPQMSWALSKAENGDRPLRCQRSRKRRLSAYIVEDRGMSNLAEFHVAMGLIYRRLNEMRVPDVLIPPSRRDLDESVDGVKDLVRGESRTGTASSAGSSTTSYLKNRSFNSSAPSFEANRDATIYRHPDDDNSSTRGVYKPRSRHVDRDTVRSRFKDNDPPRDLSDVKRSLANIAYMLDKISEEENVKPMMIKSWMQLVIMKLLNLMGIRSRPSC